MRDLRESEKKENQDTMLLNTRLINGKHLVVLLRSLPKILLLRNLVSWQISSKSMKIWPIVTLF